jgi:2-polyprenyl-3-methyl-5-hydroxy-6-metoxy-1,4-benzoquinol methylase
LKTEDLLQDFLFFGEERKNMWEHLIDNSIDERFDIVSKYFGDRIKGKHIVDMNCGVGHFVNFIDGYASYYGNDIKKEFIKNTPKKENAVFEVLNEKKLPKRLKNKPVDILVLFGAGVVDVEGKNTKEILEKIVSIKKPEAIVIEGTWEYEEKFRLMSYYEAIFSNYGYKLVFKKRYKGTSVGEHVLWVLDRYIVIMERT